MKTGKHKEKKYFIETKRDAKNVMRLVFLRTITVMLLLFSAILTTMSMLFRPWKQEFLPRRPIYLEFSVFHVCRVLPIGTTCYEGAYEGAPAWFRAFQTFLLMATTVQYLSTFFIIFQLVRFRNDQIKQFWIPGLASLLSAAFILTALLLTVGYWHFEFMEDVRLYKMGWMVEQDTEEVSGYPRKMAWGASGMAMAVSLLCFCVHFYDKKYTLSYRMSLLQRQAERAVYDFH